MANLHEKIEKVGAVEKKSVLRLDEFVERRQVDGEFSAMMDKKLPEHIEEVKPSLDELARSQGQGVNPAATSDEIVAQTKQANQKIEGIKEDLQTPNLQIKNNVSRLMDNKLTHIDESLKIALTKAGTSQDEFAKPIDVREDQKFSPVGRFVDHLTHSQSQLERLGSYLEALTSQEQELSPANMLAIQIKVNHIQQELEFFTNLLNKSIESTKALMNVQV